MTMMVMMNNDDPVSGTSLRRLLAILVLAAIVLFGGGLAFSFTMQMIWVDRVTFMFCLGVVYMIGATAFTAWKGPRDRRQ